jgi:hypothetical protein
MNGNIIVVYQVFYVLNESSINVEIHEDVVNKVYDVKRVRIAYKFFNAHISDHD